MSAALALHQAKPTKLVPVSLATLAEPPAFDLQPPGERLKPKFQWVLEAEGLRLHDALTIREEALRGLRRLWTAEEYATGSARLAKFWADVDAARAPDPDEVAKVDRLTGKLAEAWRPLAEMAADNARFTGEAPKIALSVTLLGWEALTVPKRREFGCTPLSTIDAIEAALSAVERELGAEPGAAFAELTTAALRRANDQPMERTK